MAFPPRGFDGCRRAFNGCPTVASPGYNAARMVRHYIPKGVRNGQARSGRFTTGNRLAKGRPVGAGNKFPEPPKEMDPRLATTRRFRALLAGIVVDLGGEE